METMAYKYGGAEAYVACLVEVLQQIFSDAHINLITEHLKGRAKLSENDFVEMQNKAYGTNIKNDYFSLLYFPFTKIDENAAKNKVSRALKIIRKEFFAIKRFNSIRNLSKGSDLFINGSFNIVSGIGKKNLCLVHFPRKSEVNSGINNRLSFFRARAKEREVAYQSTYDFYLPNSKFTAGHLKELWLIPEEKIKLLYPPVKMVEREQSKNKSQILVCSRIHRDKKIDVLIKAFMSSEFLRNNAHLVVAGSVLGEDEDFVRKIQDSVENVTFVFEPTREALESLYSKSGIFWHAMGFAQENPEKFEHFGITTVEAMSAGCVPIVINKGGQTEIVTENCGVRWNTLEELLERTEWLIKNPDEADLLRKNAVERSAHFDKSHFTARIKEILSEVDCA